MALGAALVVVIGAAVALGAAPAGSGAGASPATNQATASGSPEPDKGPKMGHGFGHGGFGPGALGGLGQRFGNPGQGEARGFGHITISAISGSTLSLATDDGWTRTIALTATTTITRGGAPATAADLHVGDRIRLRQSKNADGTFTVSAINVVLPEVVGTITDTTGTSITILDRDGTSIVVHLGAATKLRVRGIDSPKASDLAKGMIAIVVGEPRSDGSIDATAVGAGTFPGPRNGPKGDRPKQSEAPEASDAPD